MKKVILFIALLSLPVLAAAQNKFLGDWYVNMINDDDDFQSRHLVIGNTTIFRVVDNQLGLECNNVYKKDTLYLYVIGTDQNTGFMGPKFYPPAPKSLFAKCYVANHEIHIIYTQKMFCDNIKTLQLKTVMYRH